MLFHHISASDVRPGDHLYRWRRFKLIQGIAVRPNNDALGIFVVMSIGLNGFRLVTLEEFKGKGILRRVLYDQGDSYLHSIKLTGTSFTEKKRPAEEIVQNALLLLDTNNINPEFIEQFFAYGAVNFARLCCITSHEQWRRLLQPNEHNSSSVNHIEQVPHLISSTPVTKQEIEELEDKQSCPICMDRLCDVAFGCGHLACSQCAQPLNTCHICRLQIHQKIQLFWSL